MYIYVYKSESLMLISDFFQLVVENNCALTLNSRPLSFYRLCFGDFYIKSFSVFT